MFGRFRTWLPALARCAWIVALCLCATRAAQAQQASRNPFSAALGALGLTPPPAAPAPDFVTSTRPTTHSLTYVPIGAHPAQPSSKPLSRDEIQAEEADLSALRARDDLRAGHKPPVVDAASAAGRPVVAKKKKAPACRITCTITTAIGRHSPIQ
jgi:hypothetical protein